MLDSIGVTVPLAVRTDADQIEAVLGLGDLERAQRLLARFEQRRRERAATVDAVDAAARAGARRRRGGRRWTQRSRLLDRAPAYDELPFDHARNLLVRGSLERRLRRKRAAAESLTKRRRDLRAARLAGLGAPAHARSSDGSGCGAATPTS